MNDDIEIQVDETIMEINGLPEKSVLERVKKTGRILWAIEVQGGLMRRYQKKLAEGIGWHEKDLTIRHAVYCTLIPAFFQTAVASYFADKVNEPITDSFLMYQSFYVLQGTFRTTYAQITKKSAGAIGLIPVLANAAYVAKDIAVKGKNKLERMLEEI